MKYPLRLFQEQKKGWWLEPGVWRWKGIYVPITTHIDPSPPPTLLFSLGLMLRKQQESKEIFPKQKRERGFSFLWGLTPKSPELSEGGTESGSLTAVSPGRQQVFNKGLLGYLRRHSKRKAAGRRAKREQRRGVTSWRRLTHGPPANSHVHFCSVK